VKPAAALLSKYREDANILDGGRTLLSWMNFRMVTPAELCRCTGYLRIVEAILDAARSYGKRV
jgi:aerobic-type carbon monoxide dehydrogenase small subunit (CoxS/CutS family)